MRDYAHAILLLSGWLALLTGSLAAIVVLFGDAPPSAVWAARGYAALYALSGAITWAGCIIAVGISEESRETAHALKRAMQ